LISRPSCGTSRRFSSSRRLCASASKLSLQQPAPNSTSHASPTSTAQGEFWGHPETQEFGELLIDLEEDWALRAVLVGMREKAMAAYSWMTESAGRGVVIGSA
jgi:hypothetical protein